MVNDVHQGAVAPHQKKKEAEVIKSDWLWEVDLRMLQSDFLCLDVILYYF